MAVYSASQDKKGPFAPILQLKLNYEEAIDSTFCLHKARKILKAEFLAALHSLLQEKSQTQFAPIDLYAVYGEQNKKMKRRN